MSKQYKFHYHIAPPYGLLNDPNGLVQFRGKYHVFFQWNQKGTTHKNKSWGHMVSDDMIDWQMLPPALEPVDWFDKNGVYSGSAIIFEDKLYLFYTGNVKDDNDVRSTYQCLATSTDGITFEKHGVLFEYPEGYTAHTRDPKVWFNQDKKIWQMVLGAQREDLTGDTVLYESTDLYHWNFVGSIYQFDKPLGYMWECPDLVTIDGEDVFFFSPQGLEPQGYLYHNIYQTAYSIGRFNGETFANPSQEFIEQDRGFEWYAPQTFQSDDGRVIQYGWMGIMEPEKEETMPTVKDGWIHHLSVPRELNVKQGRLYQYPVRELEALRGEASKYQVDTCGTIALTQFASDIEIIRQNSTDSFKMMIYDAVELVYDTQANVLTIERENWSNGQKEYRRVALGQGVANMRILLEDSSIELFINDGQEVVSMRYFDEQAQPRLILEDAAKITTYPMRSCMMTDLSV